MNLTLAKHSAELQSDIVDWAQVSGFNAPYGVLTGSHVTKTSGRKYLSVTFGRARTLDVSVEIFNRNFILVRSSRHGGTMTFKNVVDLQEFLESL